MALTPQPLFFDEEAEFAISAGRLPHWEQVGTVCFITFRTRDSMPRAVVERFLREQDVWLKARCVDRARTDWERELDRLTPAERAAFRRLCSDRWESALDGCLGSCPLRDPVAARVVTESLTHHDGERYSLFDFVVMPNHVHVLASFPELGAVRRQCEAWKRFTATRLNRMLGRTGRFWEEEAFDHLVRSETQFERLRDYLADNPVRAGLSRDEFAHYSRPLPLSPPRTPVT